MRKGVRLITLLALSALAVRAAGRSAAPSVAGSGVDRYDVAWDSPSADHHGSMPLGNGDIALNAWMTEPGNLHFHINKTERREVTEMRTSDICANRKRADVTVVNSQRKEP